MESHTSDSTNDQAITNIVINGWTEHHEDIFLEWADKAMCYRWLHSRSFNVYSRRAAYYTIPVIIMSTITGTANFAQDKFPEDYKVMAQMTIGAINIIAGILTTISQYFKINELNESHRASSISWSKFYQNIKVEMSKDPSERKKPTDMLNHYKEEFDRLLEISPTIDDNIIHEFKKKFGKKDKGKYHSDTINNKYHNQVKDIIDNNELDQKELDSSIDDLFDNYLVEMNKFAKQNSKNKFHYLKKPDICDELISISENKRDWYKVVDRPKHTIMYDSPEMLDRATKRKEEEMYHLQISKFVDEYRSLKGQYPLLEDIIDNKRDDIPIDILRSISISVLKSHYGEMV